MQLDKHLVKKKYLDLVFIAPKLLTINFILFIPFIIISFLSSFYTNNVLIIIKVISLIFSGVFFCIIIFLIIFEQIQDKYFRFKDKRDHYWVIIKKNVYECSFCGYRQNNIKNKICNNCYKLNK